MKVLVFGLTIFCAAFVLHLMVWKIRLPNRQVKTMLLIFFAVLLGSILILLNAPSSFKFFDLAPPENIWEYLHICLFFISLTLAYMITYSALEADSPSLVMVMTISRAEPEGLDKKRFGELMSDETLVMPRIRDVLTDKMAYMEGGRYRLTPKGALMARLFILWRRLINAPEEGG
ncbi:MAG: hypothetical protein AB1499_02000 [Nitrospirota bacterium]